LVSLFLLPPAWPEWSGTSPMGRGALLVSLFLLPPAWPEWSGISPMGRGALLASLFLLPPAWPEWSSTSPMGRGALSVSLFLPPAWPEWSGTSPMGRGALPVSLFLPPAWPVQWRGRRGALYIFSKSPTPILCAAKKYYNHLGGQPKSVQEQYEWMQKVCAAKPNLHFMDKDEFRVGTNITILGTTGTTLWSAIPPSAELVAKQSLNDYHRSYVSVDRKLTPNVTNQWYTENREWLTNKIQEAKERRHTVVVLTHHTPSMEGTSDPKYDGNPVGHCFSTNLTRLLVDPVAFWVCGHTHYNFDYPSSFGPDSSTTRLVSNQRGYPGREKKEYKNKMVIEVSSRTR
jgi:hypothetical protein